MGLNLSLQDSNNHFKDVEGWDYLRYAGDKEFVLLELPTDRIETSPYSGEYAYQPVIFEDWRKAIENFENKDRFDNLLDLLENNPSYYFYPGW